MDTRKQTFFYLLLLEHRIRMQITDHAVWQCLWRGVEPGASVTAAVP